MTKAVAVIDTNVVVSGLISSDEQSPVCRILDGMLNATFPFLLSPALLHEYRNVLLRPNLRKLHGLNSTDIDRLLSQVVANAVWREPKPTSSAPEPGDDHLWALLAVHPGSILVTGDRLLLDNPPDFASVLTPRSFLEVMQIS
jgi:putative PIN family toxin of toxin-antitoxin system